MVTLPVRESNAKQQIQNALKVAQLQELFPEVSLSVLKSALELNSADDAASYMFDKHSQGSSSAKSRKQPRSQVEQRSFYTSAPKSNRS